MLSVLSIFRAKITKLGVFGAVSLIADDYNYSDNHCLHYFLG
jgi:hypothetical protein